MKASTQLAARLRLASPTSPARACCIRVHAGCGPCRMIEPIITELQKEYGDRLKCVKLNTDESPQVATDYGIRSIPTVSARQ